MLVTTNRPKYEPTTLVETGGESLAETPARAGDQDRPSSEADGLVDAPVSSTLWAGAKVALTPQARAERTTQIIDRALGQLAALASEPARFHATLETAFGAGVDRAAAEDIRRKLLAGDRSWLPTIALADADALGGARGAYAGDRGTVFINEDIRSPKRAAEVLIEELGHHLDARLTGRDSPGDEGEIFRRLVAGETLSDLTLDRLRAENDHGVMNIDGQAVEVENWGWPRWLTDLIVGSKPVQDALKATKDNLIRYFGGFDARIKAAAKGWIDDIVANAKAYGPELLKSMENVASGFQKLAKGDLTGGLADIGRGLGNTALESFHAFARLTVDTVSAVQTALGLEPVGRQLRGDEITRLRAVYGDSIDYSKVTIKEGGAGIFAGDRALTMGNTVYMKDSTSFATLTHELAHVWQFQNGGNDYMLKAGWAQFSNWAKGNDTHVAYDWTRDIGRGWAALNPEQQAELIENIVSSGYLDEKAAWPARRAAYEAREAAYQVKYAGSPASRRDVVGFGGGGLGSFGGGQLIDFRKLQERRALDQERAILDAGPRFRVNDNDYTAAAEDALDNVRNRRGAP